MRQIRRLVVVCVLLSAALFPMAALAESEPNNTIQSASTIGVGYNKGQGGAISSASDVDFYKFTTAANRTYVIETYNIQGQPNSAATGLWLYNASGGLLANDSYGSRGTGSTDARLIFTFVQAGTYYIRVASSEYGTWLGSYSLRVLPKFNESGAGWNAQADQEPNDTREIANAIGVGYAHAVTRQLFDYRSFVTNGPDRDFYRFAATAGYTYVIETFGIQGQPNGAATGLWLFSSAGAEVDDDGYGSQGTGNADARIVFTATASANYFIMVAPSEYGWWVGSYSLRVLPKFNEPGADWNAGQEPNDTREIAHAIGVGLEHAVTHKLIDYRSFVTNGPDRDFYRFAATAGYTYVIETFGIQGRPNGAATGLWLYSGAGAQIGADGYGSQGTGNADARIVFTATASTNYFIMVAPSEYGWWVGSYSLRVLPRYDQPGAAWSAADDYEPNDTIETAYQINVGLAGAQSHRLFPNDSFVTNGPDRDFYRFEARAGRRYIIQTYGSNGTGLWLYSPTGAQLANDAYGSGGRGQIDAEMTFTFSSSGTYFVMVRQSEYGAWAGRYSLRVCASSCNRQVFLPMIRRR